MNSDTTAIVYGTAFTEVPRDLFIPPEALSVYLESFQGPLDLLLYLIRRAKFNILDIPMAALTRQYLEYVEAMRARNLNLAADYLVMAAILIDIKTRMLLPRPPSMVDEVEEEDPRSALIRRLLHYEQIQKAALRLNEVPQSGRDFFWGQSEVCFDTPLLKPEVQAKDLFLLWQGLLTRLKARAHFEIPTEALSLREQMSFVLKRLQGSPNRHLEFFSLFEKRSNLHWVVGFIAVLELAKQGMVHLEQGECQLGSPDSQHRHSLAPLYVSANDLDDEPTTSADTPDALTTPAD